MVASTDIKFYVHTNNNAPQLQNAYGSMINVLDACLINGIQIGVLSSLTAVGNTVTAIFGTAHNLMPYQVIKITGATQSEFNTEHRVLTVPNSTTITFELANAPSVTTATGTIAATLPPLGWEKSFSSIHATVGGKAAYRSKNMLLSSRPFLRIVDEPDPAYNMAYAKYAKVGIVENMTDIDTMSGVQAPYDSAVPLKNWIGTGSQENAYNGWAKWYYARTSAEFSGNTAGGNYSDAITPENGKRNWFVVGNKDYFYIMPAVRQIQTLLYGFGAFSSNLSVDSSCNFLIATVNYAKVAGESDSFFSVFSKVPAVSTDIGGILVQRNIQQSSYAMAGTSSLQMRPNTASYHSGTVNYTQAVAAIEQVIFADVFINESNFLRGLLPGLKWLFQLRPINDLEGGFYGDKLYIAKNTYLAYPQIYDLEVGQVLFELT